MISYEYWFEPGCQGRIALDPLAGLCRSTNAAYKKGKGPLPSNSCRGLVYIRTELNSDPRLAVQLHMITTTAAVDHVLVMLGKLGKLSKLIFSICLIWLLGTHGLQKNKNLCCQTCIKVPSKPMSIPHYSDTRHLCLG